MKAIDTAVLQNLPTVCYPKTLSFKIFLILTLLETNRSAVFGATT